MSERVVKFCWLQKIIFFESISFIKKWKNNKYQLKTLSLADAAGVKINQK